MYRVHESLQIFRQNYKKGQVSVKTVETMTCSLILWTGAADLSCSISVLL